MLIVISCFPIYSSATTDVQDFEDQTSAPPEPEDENAEDDNFNEEEEKALEAEERERFAKPKAAPVRPRGRMTSVFVAPINMEEKWEPKVFSHSDGARSDCVSARLTLSGH